MDDPILVELEEDDYWYRGYNMRTGERGIFPAFYAHEVVGQARDAVGRSLWGPWGPWGVMRAVGDTGGSGRHLLVPVPVQA